MVGRRSADQRGPGVVISTKVHPDAKDEMRSRAARSGQSTSAWLRELALGVVGGPDVDEDRRSAHEALEAWAGLKGWKHVSTSIHSAVAKLKGGS